MLHLCICPDQYKKLQQEKNNKQVQTALRKPFYLIGSSNSKLRTTANPRLNLHMYMARRSNPRFTDPPMHKFKPASQFCA